MRRLAPVVALALIAVGGFASTSSAASPGGTYGFGTRSDTSRSSARMPATTGSTPRCSRR